MINTKIRFSNSCIIAALLLIIAGATSCQKELSGEDFKNEQKFNVHFSFSNSVQLAPLQLNSTSYTNAFNERFTVGTFRYYVSHIALRNTATESYSVADDQYFLINEADPASKEFTVAFPPGKYNKVRFLLGVDSSRNVSGAQTGALDVINGMFWDWNSGYVMAKLEGSSDAATTPNKQFSYHIGGFRTGESALRTIALEMPVGIEITVDSQANGHISINADINTWFSGVYNLPIATTPFIHSPGGIALQYADNYAKMFSILSAGNF